MNWIISTSSHQMTGKKTKTASWKLQHPLAIRSQPSFPYRIKTWSWISMSGGERRAEPFGYLVADLIMKCQYQLASLNRKRSIQRTQGPWPWVQDGQFGFILFENWGWLRMNGFLFQWLGVCGRFWSFLDGKGGQICADYIAFEGHFRRYCAYCWSWRL